LVRSGAYFLHKGRNGADMNRGGTGLLKGAEINCGMNLPTFEAIYISM
jgi:hypothetical protein